METCSIGESNNATIELVTLARVAQGADNNLGHDHACAPRDCTPYIGCRPTDPCRPDDPCRP